MTKKPIEDNLYLEVIDKIKLSIKKGKYKEREQLPSEFELSKTLNVSRAVLKKALRVLEEENIIIQRYGLGTFVNPKPLFSSGIEELTSVTDTIIQSGKIPNSQYLSTELVLATAEEKEKFLPLQKVESLVKIERIRTANDQPVVFCVDKFPEGLIPTQHLYQEQSMLKLLEKYANKTVSYAITYIEPIGYHERIHGILNCDPEQSLLLLKQIHYTENDVPVLYSTNYFRPDMFSFHVLRKR